MPDQVLLTAQRNEVLKAIEVQGLPAGHFGWEAPPATAGSRQRTEVLRHSPSGFYFQFTLQGTSHLSTYSPGAERTHETRTSRQWSQQLAYVRKWLGYVKREIRTANLWDQISSGDVLLPTVSDPVGQVRFSLDEQQRIAAELNRIREWLLARRDFTPEQRAYLDAQVAYLRDASERLNKKDWVMLATGVMAFLISVLALPPETSRGLFALLGHTVQVVAQLVVR